MYVRNGKEGLLIKDSCVRGQETKWERNCQSQSELGHANKNKEQRSKCSSMIQTFFFFFKYRKWKLAALG